MMPKYHLGTLDAASRIKLSEPTSESKSDIDSPTFLNSRSWKQALLTSKKQISSDTFIFTFTLSHPSQTLGLPTGQHLLIRLRDPATREAIIRPYTPISHVSQAGTMDVLIKLYLSKNATNPSGKMSRAISSIPLGHAVDFKGPVGKFKYLGKGICSVNERQRCVRKFIMICGGSGITPIYQVFRSVMQDKDDQTVCTLLDGNRLVEDILCKEELDALLCRNEHKADVLHTLSQPPKTGWNGLKGRICEDLLRQTCRYDDYGLSTTRKENKSTEVPNGTKSTNSVADVETKKSRTATLANITNKDSDINKKKHSTTKNPAVPMSTDAPSSVTKTSEGDLQKPHDIMALVCGPEAMEKSVNGWLKDMGWKTEDILFF